MILATAGHIDHGKTALVQALTGTDADRLPEEKRRGMTIDLGFAYASLPDGSEIGFVDVPGHERFLPNMLAGVLGIDRVLLVVAADDGPRPQTLEHLDILDLIGVGPTPRTQRVGTPIELTGIVTKIDRVAPERTAAVVAELAALFAVSGFEGSPILAVSSRTGEGVPALLRHLEERARAAREVQTAAAPGLFRMPIDRAFTLAGIGLVVTGTIASGAVAVGDHLISSPRGVELRVRGLHAHNQSVARAARGERCAVAIAGSFPEGGAPARGDWLVAAERHAPSGRLDLWLRASRLAPAPLRDGLPVHLHLGTEDVVGRLAVLAGAAIAPGESGYVQVDLAHPIGALWGDRVVLRDHAARHTLAGGRVIDPFAPRRGRRTPARLAVLEAITDPDTARALARRLALEGVVDLARWALARNLGPNEIAALLARGTHRAIGHPPAYAVSGDRFAALGEAIVAALACWHREQPDALGPTQPALLARLPGTAPPPVLEAALAELASAGRIVRTGAAWRLKEHQPRLVAADERLWGRVLPLLAAAGLRPPRVRELAELLALDPAATARFLARVERFGRVAKVADNRYFLPETLAALANTARALAATSPDGTFTAAGFNERTGVGRNLAIEILEFFDRIGVTRRVGDARVSLRGGGELFGCPEPQDG
ncbi:MAG: selenocysteine-specific translation elongation factor [Stellaceae bacterium]